MIVLKFTPILMAKIKQETVSFVADPNMEPTEVQMFKC